MGSALDAVTLGLLAVGLVLLVLGGEALVRGASRLAAAAGISPLVVGLTVVAFGTSAPEAAVSLQSALAGQADIALGNVVGSNIFNVLFILGLSALIAPLVVARQLVRLDVPILIGVSLLVLVLALDGEVGTLDGLLLLGGIVAYTVFVLRESQRERGQAAAAGGSAPVGRPTARQWVANIALVLVGLGLLVLGARWLVQGATALARGLGISEVVIGLTIVAAGTSLPEVAASLIATQRGERDIAVGNVIGSCIFNLLFILGLTAVTAPSALAVAPALLAFDLPVMLAAAVACLPIFFTRHRIDRWEGLLFLGYYLAYTLFLVLDSAGHDALPAFSAAMLEFVLPLTVVTLLVLFVRARGGDADRSPA
ncbi:MAG: calcium/sodium antiporter [Chloroflexota bacterium]